MVQSTSDAVEHAHSHAIARSRTCIQTYTSPNCHATSACPNARNVIASEPRPGRADAAWQVVHSAISALAAGSSAWVEHTLLAALANGGGGGECGALLRIDVDEARRRKESGVFYRPRARFGSHSRPSAFSHCAGYMHGTSG